MANLSLHDPMLGRLNKLFNNFFWHPSLFEQQQDGLTLKLDVSEGQDAYTIRADIPGVNKEDIKVSVDGNQVSISAEVKRTKEEKKDQEVVYSERYEGKVFRSFTLDTAVDAAAAQAKYADGVLELTLPKKADASTRRIEVQ